MTALGDEVNEAARIQEVCRGGGTLVSKEIVERLDPDAASAIGIDPAAVAYRILGEVPEASEKAKRDAGSLATRPSIPLAAQGGRRSAKKAAAAPSWSPAPSSSA